MASLPGIVTEQKQSTESIEESLAGISDTEIVAILEGYRTEAEYSRLSGPNSRDLTWLMNLDLYWNRYDFSKKAPWQAREVMPELPQYVDRFASAMRTALRGSEDFFTIKVENDEEDDIAQVIRKVMKTQLRRIARSPSGHDVDFLNVFEELIKMACLMMFSATVTVKKEKKGHYVSVDPVDPYNIWLDPTGRGLYRIRRIECDLHELMGFAEQTDANGKFLYNKDQIELCQAAAINAMMRAEREKRTGTGQWVHSTRIPVILHEYLCTLIDNTGKCRGENVLCVVANNAFLIRGPEKNPFWHQKDFLITSPLITVPMSPYGRTYVENFASIAKTFTELTNLLLDGVFTSAMKAFIMVPDMLEDPNQVNEGVHPNVVFRAQGGALPKEVIQEINLGQLPADAITMWQALKKELQEGAAFNDISLGNFAQHSRTSATEVGSAEQNSNSYLMSIASNIETGFVEPLLDLIWHTTIQHLDKSDTEIADAVGPTWFETLLKSKKQFAEMKMTFICRGISSLVQRGQKLQKLLQLLQVIGSNQVLAQQFLQEISPDRLLKELFKLSDLDMDEIAMTDREKAIAMIQQQQQQMVEAAMGGQSGPPGQGQPGAPKAPGTSAGPSGGQTVPQGGGMPQTAGRQLTQGAGGQR